MTELGSFDVRIAPDRTHFLKFILEGYDGLAMLSTIDAQSGHVRLRFSSGAGDEVRALLQGLSPQLGGVTYL
jgi:hypothetical protein